MYKEYVAYCGKNYIIEWYYTEQGKSEALNFYNKLNMEEKIKALHLFKRMGDMGEIKDITKFNYEGDHIYAFKPKPNRFLCFFFSDGKMIITNAFCKKQRKLPRNEKTRAEKNKKDYELRVIKGKYYDKT